MHSYDTPRYSFEPTVNIKWDCVVSHQLQAIMLIFKVTIDLGQLAHPFYEVVMHARRTVFNTPNLTNRILVPNWINPTTRVKPSSLRPRPRPSRHAQFPMHIKKKDLPKCMVHGALLCCLYAPCGAGAHMETEVHRTHHEVSRLCIYIQLAGLMCAMWYVARLRAV
jgi:hypothetical protein